LNLRIVTSILFMLAGSKARAKIDFSSSMLSRLAWRTTRSSDSCTSVGFWSDERELYKCNLTRR
jgi:hypothetical protein